MNEMVQRVAKALAREAGWTGAEEGRVWLNYEMAARAAIRAMFQPTEAMVNKARSESRNAAAAADWRAMIRAALE